MNINTMKLKKELKNKKCIGKWVTFHHKNNKKHKYRGICVDEVIEISNEYAHRLQKIIWCQKKHSKREKWVDYKTNELWVTIRSCYYVIKGNKKGLAFGQFCMNSHPEVVGKLFRKANKKGFFKKMTIKQMLKELDKFLE